MSVYTDRRNTKSEVLKHFMDKYRDQLLDEENQARRLLKLRETENDKSLYLRKTELRN